MLRAVSKLPKGQFKCFHCRLLFTQRDGDWVDWDSQQVHLCKGCDKKTVNDPNRSYSQSAGKG